MLGDDVVNKTVPLILCAEENVVGNHGATIGELDEDTLFYFESRGIDKQTAENILARAAIERLARAARRQRERGIYNEQTERRSCKMEYNYKNDFPLLAHSDIAYLDSAATAQRPQCVIDAERDFYCLHNANPLRGLYPLSVAATEDYENARNSVRAFIGAKSSEEIIFTRNTTESLNLVAYSYGLTNITVGDEILVSIMEHHSNLLPWQMVCRQTGATLKFMECEQDGSLDLNKVEELITDKTKIVAIMQVSNVLGREYPVKEIAAMAHKKGAVCVVDGAQSTPHMPINVQDIDADFFAFSGHKVFGPMGIGVLYGKKALLNTDSPVYERRRDDRVRHPRGRGVCRDSA